MGLSYAGARCAIPRRIIGFQPAARLAFRRLPDCYGRGVTRTKTPGSGRTVMAMMGLGPGAAGAK